MYKMADYSVVVFVLQCPCCTFGPVVVYCSQSVRGCSQCLQANVILGFGLLKGCLHTKDLCG